MEVYSCLVNQTDASGVILNQVFKPAATAAEVELLRKIHGWHRVVDVKKIGDAARLSSYDERRRLTAIYGDEKVTTMFGTNPYVGMPQVVSMPVLAEGADRPTEMDIETAHAATRLLEQQVIPLVEEAVRPQSVVPDMTLDLPAPAVPLAETDKD